MAARLLEVRCCSAGSIICPIYLKRGIPTNKTEVKKKEEQEQER